MKKAFFVLLTVLLLLTSCAGMQKDKIENTKDDSESTQKNSNDDAAIDVDNRVDYLYAKTIDEFKDKLSTKKSDSQETAAILNVANNYKINIPGFEVSNVRYEKTVKDDGSFNAETIEIEWNKSGESKDPAVYPPYIRLNAAYCSESLRSYVTGGYSRINNSEVYEKEYTTTEKITMVNYLILNSDDSDTISCFVQISFRKDVLSSEAIKDQLFDLATEVEQKLSDIAKQKH